MHKQKDLPAVEYLAVEKEDTRCLIPCPYEQKLGDALEEFGGNQIMVGSHSCLCCEFNCNSGREYDPDGNIVCAYLRETEVRRQNTEENAFRAASRAAKFKTEYEEYCEEYGPIPQEDFFVEVYRPRHRGPKQKTD